MNTRLKQIIEYRTGGNKTEFAALVGWSPQYLSKLLKGGNFGIQPVLNILEHLPEISASWLLLGKGEMFSTSKLSKIRREAVDYVEKVLTLEKYMPVMEPDELISFEQMVVGQVKPSINPLTLTKWQEKYLQREQEIDEIFNKAYKDAEPRKSKSN